MIHVQLQLTTGSSETSQLIKVRNDISVKGLKQIVDATVGKDGWTRLAFGQEELLDHQPLSVYGLYNNARLLSLPDHAPFLSFLPPMTHRATKWDRTYATQGSTTAKRGEYPYYRPKGWMRFGLSVTGKYGPDTWLGKPGPRDASSPGEWIVTYHGTPFSNVASIVKNGYNTANVWSTSDLNTAVGYSAKGHYIDASGVQWRCVIQNRLSPEASITHNRGHHAPGHYIFAVLPQQIRPYAVLIQRV
ncbi:hypothetical protein DFS34DRAFT_622376 [Phlyctochytrium arcticum]|nr:hypothetical protein DFS34DRAFT_622376 [Phlyctochytrium arcticum]